MAEAEKTPHGHQAAGAFIVRCVKTVVEGCGVQAIREPHKTWSILTSNHARALLDGCPYGKVLIPLIEALLNLMSILHLGLVRSLLEDVDHRVKPNNVGKTARNKPEPSVDGGNVGDDVTLQVLVIFVT